MAARYLQPMHIDRLRAWVRDELQPEERREVGRFILRSADPELPGILQGLIIEHEREQGLQRSEPLLEEGPE